LALSKSGIRVEVRLLPLSLLTSSPVRMKLSAV